MNQEWLKENLSSINSLNLKDYSYESCLTESSEGETQLYISNHLPFKPRSDLCIYKSTKLIVNQRKMWLWVTFIVILTWT